MCHPVDYGCGYQARHAPPIHGHQAMSCCCGHGHGLWHHPTKEEVIQRLEEYQKQLSDVMKSVEERITEFKKGEA